MLCNRFLHIIHSLDISFLYLKILAIRSWPSRKYRNCMELHVKGNVHFRCREICGSSAEDPRKLRGRGSVLIQGIGHMSNVGIFGNLKYH